MASNLTIPETHDLAAWTERIKLIDTDEPVIGGIDGVSNAQAIQLAQRAQWTKAVIGRVVAAAESVDPATTNLDQLLQAVTSLIAQATRVVETAPQFDADLSVATTEFVQRALGSHAGVRSINITTALEASDVGQTISLSPVAAGVSVTLPPLDGLPPGAGITFVNVGSAAVTVVCSGTDRVDPGGDVQTAIALGIGDTLTLCVRAGGFWVPIGGSAHLARTASFARSGSVNGEQIIGKTIIKWGYAGVVTTAGAWTLTNVTFPTKFPAACWNVVAFRGAPGSSDLTFYDRLGQDRLTATGFVLRSYTSQNAADRVNYIAIGE